MSLEIGSTLGDYQIIGILGAGGMGRVYKVRNVISDRIEALKVLLPDLANAPELADRFMREIKVQASLEHPNIASLHTAVRVENQLLMLMEYLEGMTLEQRLQQGRVPVPEAVDYIRQVLAALDYAHQRGVIHRDIKPANMMLVGSTVKLMDFGIAKAAGDQRLTMTGTTMGSLYYMSPEQIKGAANLDARADLYSVGVSLYELVTGRRPFDGDSQFAIMAAHLEKTPVPPVSIDPSLPELLNDLILMSVAKEPNERFQTAGAFRNALGGLVGAGAAPTATLPATPPPVPVMPAQPTMPPPPVMTAPMAAAPFAAAAAPAAAPIPAQPRSKRGLWMALGAVAAVLAVVAAIQFGPWKSTKAAPEPAASIPAAQTPQQPAAPAVPAPAPTQATSQPAETSPAATQPAPPQPEQQQAPAHKPSAAKMAHQVVPPTVRTQPSAPAAAQQQVVSQPSQPPAPQMAQPAQPAGPSRAEQMEFREHLAMLTTRAESARIGIDGIRRHQAASGLGLRGDIQEAVGMMNVYMTGAHEALRSSDLPAARSYANKAERQIEILEKFLNR
jgi:eukaryotic-like serine/threonine-protein kinase